MRSVAAGIAALATGFAIEAGWLHGIAPVAPNTGPGGITVIAKTQPNAAATRGAQTPVPGGMRLASLEPAVALDVAAGERPSTSRGLGAAFDQRFGFNEQPAFGERFAGDAAAAPANAPAAAPGRNEPTAVARGSAATAISAAITEPPKSAHNERLALADPRDDETSAAVRSASAPQDAKSAADTDDSRTAIYDIAAHTVYLPDGRRLEAHSGRGNLLDDPHAVNVKGRGPTPPNVYELSLRERTFHGVRAIRLTPVGEAKMFGRDGMLAHTYMLGRNGQSMGCVSFTDYPAFLNAFLKGEVNRLVVVEHLANAPDPNIASRSTSEILKSLLTRS